MCFLFGHPEECGLNNNLGSNPALAQARCNGLCSVLRTGLQALFDRFHFWFGSDSQVHIDWRKEDNHQAWNSRHPKQNFASSSLIS